jgi:pimeloyl-ACP methyl ester carboxylesterase
MKPILSKALLISFLLLPSMVLAHIAVLVHGYQGTGGSWREKGIVSHLANYGWKDAGFYAPYYNPVTQTTANQYGVSNFGLPGHTLEKTAKQIVTAELPSVAPIEVQAELLSRFLRDIHARYPDKKIHLVAHSAGGIAARLTLIRNPDLPIVQLVTIATPHLGSPLAELANKLAESPVELLTPILGMNSLERSERLYEQLSREKENYFLFWLNRQPHPDIDYVSIVRRDGSFIGGDNIVPPYSQDMALVPVIGPRSKIFYTPGRHYLKFLDAQILASVLP